MLGFPVLHYLPEFAQTHVHWGSDAIQPSHPLSPLLLLPLIFPSIGILYNHFLVGRSERENHSIHGNNRVGMRNVRVWNLSLWKAWIARRVSLGTISTIKRSIHMTDGFPVHHQLLELAQTHIHWVSDAIQPSHPLLSPSLPAFNLSQHQGPLQWVSSSHQVAKVLEFQLQHQSFQWIFRTDFL